VSPYAPFGTAIAEIRSPVWEFDRVRVRSVPPRETSARLVLVYRRRVAQRQPEIRYALQEPLELRLVTDATDQYRLPFFTRESHAFE
jgi:hypothetical protein